MTILSAMEGRLMEILLAEVLLLAAVLPVQAMITTTATTIQVGIIPIRILLSQEALVQLPPRRQVPLTTIIGLQLSILL
jgi:hypothetical protein